MSGTVWLTMAEVKWIKISVGVFDDEKIMLIEAMPDKYAIITCWFKLLCLAGKQNNAGVFLMNDRIAYTDEMLATIFRMDVNTVRLALATFESFGMIDIMDGVVTIPNWEKWQSLDDMEKIREQTKERVAKHRAKQKALLESNVTCNVTPNVTVTLRNGTDRDIDKDIDKDIDIDRESNKTAGIKVITNTPTEAAPQVDRGRARDAQEVAEFFFAEKLNGDPAAFFDHYQGINWRVGGSPITDWKAIARSWSRKEKVYGTDKPTKAAQSMGGRASSVPMSLAAFMEATANI